MTIFIFIVDDFQSEESAEPQESPDDTSSQGKRKKIQMCLGLYFLQKCQKHSFIFRCTCPYFFHPLQLVTSKAYL